MAFSVVHLLIARQAAAPNPTLLWDGAYYLGAISPDAVHVRPGVFSKSPAKRESHLHASGDGEKEVRAYWAQNGKTPFTLGYGIHVLADKLWVRFYPRTFPGLMAADGQTIPAIYAPDAGWIDHALYVCLLRDMNITDLLLSAKPPENHPWLSGEDFLQWRNHELSLLAAMESMPKGSPRAMDYGAVVRFIEDAGNTLQQYLI